MNSKITLKPFNFTRMASAMVAFAFLFCVFSGFSQSVIGAVLTPDRVVSCCPSQMDMAVGSDTPLEAHDGVCGSDKLVFLDDPVTISPDFYLMGPVISLDDSDTSFTYGTFAWLDAPVVGIHSPPLYVLRFGVNAPPAT